MHVWLQKLRTGEGGGAPAPSHCPNYALGPGVVPRALAARVVGRFARVSLSRQIADRFCISVCMADVRQGSAAVQSAGGIS
jgi:hypothetical protein